MARTAETMAAPQNVASQLLTVAWMAVALGILLELSIALGVLALGGNVGPHRLVADVAQRIAWSTIVCLGLAFAKAFAPGAQGASAWAGMLAGPAAFAIARAVHKGLSQAMGLGVASTAPALLILLATIKALEYGLLGMVLARLDKRLDNRGGAMLRRYLGAGAVVGLVFGGSTLVAVALFSPKPPTTVEWMARGANELLFPLGCSLVLFAAGLAGRGLASVSPDERVTKAAPSP